MPAWVKTWIASMMLVLSMTFVAANASTDSDPPYWMRVVVGTISVGLAWGGCALLVKERRS